jgi:hypothetical protein
MDQPSPALPQSWARRWRLPASPKLPQRAPELLLASLKLQRHELLESQPLPASPEL